MTQVIDRFFGEYRFLSNFWLIDVEFEGIIYPSVEHAYVAAKTLDQRLRAKIATVAKPGDVKKIGRMLELRPDWESVKLEIMRSLLLNKFLHPELAQKLISTGDAELIEGNTWGDIYWGVCNGKGENNLGKLLMGLRSFLRIYYVKENWI